jgi:hypothetical protein
MIQHPIQSGDESFLRAVLITGLVVVSATITVASPMIRSWFTRLSIDPITQQDMDEICKTITSMDEDEVSLQWTRDKNRIAFVGMDSGYIDERMRWAIPFVVQTVPNSVWCVLNKRNGKDVVFTSPSNGLSVHRISDAHIRCHLRFLVVRLDENNMVSEGSEGSEGDEGKVEVSVVYDVVDTGYGDGDLTDPHILLVECVK